MSRYDNKFTLTPKANGDSRVYAATTIDKVQLTPQKPTEIGYTTTNDKAHTEPKTPTETVEYKNELLQQMTKFILTRKAKGN